MSGIDSIPHPRCGGQRSARSGFTLVEVLVASSLGALLLLAAATSAGAFGKQVEYLCSDSQDVAAEALADVSNDARYAWCVQVPDAHHLVLLDSDGGETRYSIVGGALTVTRPDGSQGVVSSSITGASFTAHNIERYREATPVLRGAALWVKAAPLLAAAQAYVLLPGEQLGLGFMLASPAPVAGSVAGVPEQTLSATLSLLNLKLAAVAPASGSLTITLYRARGPGDSRPEGSSLGQVAVALSGLPAARTTTDLGGAGLKNTLVDDSGGSSGSSGNNGNSGNTENDGNTGDHANNGNHWGNGNGSSDGGSGSSSGDASLLVLAPTASVPIDLSSLGSVVRPGRAYTLVIGNTAGGPVALEGYVLASPSLSGVYLGDASTSFAAQPVSVPRSLDGTATMSSTTSTSVARSLLIELTSADGGRVSGTVAVMGASLVDEAWLGAIPGEVGP